MQYKGPIILVDFEIIPIEAVRGQIFWGENGSGSLGADPPSLLGEETKDQSGSG